MNNTSFFLSLTAITIGVFMLVPIGLFHVTGPVYGVEIELNQSNIVSKETLVNQSTEPASNETVMLYRPYVMTNGQEIENLVENETVVFSGFVQSNSGLRGHNISLYAITNDKEKDNLLGTYVIDDPVSTQFSFKVKITPELVKDSIDNGNQLQFKAYHGDVPSNIITANLLVNGEKESKYEQIFDPQEYNIPTKLILSANYAGKTSNSFAYLSSYKLTDKSTDNVHEHFNTEDDVDKFDTRRDYNWNLTSGNSIVSLNFENGNPNPLSMDVFLEQTEYLETRDGADNDSIPVLYRFDNHKDEIFKFETPLVREGVYTIDINVFFENGIRATYVLSKIGVWIK